MDNGTCVAFILFCIFRHYKRVGIYPNKSEMLSDIETCRLLLKQMSKNVDPTFSTELVHALIKRINGFGANVRLQFPLRYTDFYDQDIINIMIWITDEIIAFLKSPFYGKHTGEIFTRFLVLHNLPRVLLDNDSGDLSTMANLHMSKQEALECVSVHLGKSWNYKKKHIILKK